MHIILFVYVGITNGFYILVSIFFDYIPQWMFILGGSLIYSQNLASSVYIMYLLVKKFNQDISEIEEITILMEGKNVKQSEKL